MATKKLSAVLEFGGKVGSSFNNALGATTKRIKGLGSTIAENTKRQVKLRKEMAKLGDRNSGYFEARRELEKLTRDTDRLIRRQKRLAFVNRAVKGTFRGLARAGKFALKGLAVGAVAAAAGLTKLLVSTAAYGDEVGKTSRRLDTTVESLEALRFIARRSGVENTVLEKSIQKIQIALGEAADNAEGPYAKAFRALGINHRAFAKLKPEEQIAELADAYGTLGTQSEKTFVLNKVLGEEGLKLAQVLELQGDGVRALTKEYEGLGGGIGTAGSQASEKFTDAMENLKTQTANTFRSIAAVALPQATAAMERLTSFMKREKVDIEAVGAAIGHVIDKLVLAIEKTLEFASVFGKRIQFDNELQAASERAAREQEEKFARNRRLAPQAGQYNVVFNVSQREGEDGAAFARRVAEANRIIETQRGFARFSGQGALLSE